MTVRAHKGLLVLLAVLVVGVGLGVAGYFVGKSTTDEEAPYSAALFAGLTTYYADREALGGQASENAVPIFNALLRSVRSLDPPPRFEAQHKRLLGILELRKRITDQSLRAYREGDRAALDALYPKDAGSQADLRITATEIARMVAPNR